MLDDLRNDDSSPLFDFEDDFEEEEPEFEDDAPQAAAASKFTYNPHMLGMTPVQRFTLAVLFFVMVCMMSVMFLVVTGRVVLF